MPLDHTVVLILIISGIIVGFINTLAGGATIISMTVFMVLGLPVTTANGTNRVAVVLQNLTSSINFIRQRHLDVRVGLKLSIPTIIGSVIGAQVASTIDEQLFKWCLGAVLLIMLVFMVMSDDKRLKGDGRSDFKVTPIHYFWFLLIGFYSGYIYVGLGYLILAVTIMSLKMDIVKANALKGFVVLVSTPFSLAIFMWNNEVAYMYGLIHAAGNILGAILASQYGHNWGVGFIRWLMVVVIGIVMADMFGLISIRDTIWSIIG